MFPGDAAKAELRQGCREQGGWAEFLRSKLMCDLGSRGLGAHTASWRRGLLPGSQIRLVLPGISASCTQGAATASNPLEESERSLGKPIPRSCHRQDGRIDSQMTASATQPARLVCHTVSLLAGRKCQKCHHGATSPGFGASLCPWQASREGQQRQCPQAHREGRKEEGTGSGSRGARPVGAACLFSMGGAYLCHRLGLITGTCLQPRRLPASVITSNRAGPGSPAHPRVFTAARSPARVSPSATPPCWWPLDGSLCPAGLGPGWHR